MKKLLLSIMMLAACAMGMSADELTIGYVSDATNSRVPINGLYVDTEGTISQVYYDADSLIDLPVGAVITGMKFYCNSVNFKDALFQLSMGAFEANPYTTGSGPAATGLTVVATNVPSPEYQAQEFTLVFDEPFAYDGGGLVFETMVTTSGSYSSTYFKGNNTTDYVAMSRTSAERFMPMTTIIYELTNQDYLARINPKSIDFGKIAPNSTMEQTVTLTNRGLNPFTPTITSVNAPFSAVLEAAELAPGASVQIPVTFAPTEEGTFDDEITIDCGQAGVQTISVTGISSLEFEMTVCDGGDYAMNYPYKGTYTDTQGTMAQMLYSADKLQGIEGAQIIGIKFYGRSNLPAVNATLQLSLAEVDFDQFEVEDANQAPTNLVTDLNVMGDVVLSGGSRELQIDFDQPYTYNGGTLVVNTEIVQAGSYSSVSFDGENQEQYVSYAKWGASSMENSKFSPKMTLIYKINSEEPQPEVKTLAGNVTDEQNLPLEGVNVTVTVTAAPAQGDAQLADAQPVTYNTVTDAQGNYSVDVTLVEGATYQATFAKDGYVEQTVAVEDLDTPLNIVMEAETTVGISDINAARVASVRYVNAMGQISDKPFKGVNIVVTTLVDGTQTTTKVIK